MLEKFDPFSCDLGLLQYIRSLDNSRQRRRWAVAFGLLPIVALAIVTLIERSFFAGDYLSRIIAMPSAIFDGIFSETTVDSAKSPDDGTYPLMGDFVVGTVYLLQVVNICIVYKQWRVMESFFTELHRNRVVSFDAQLMEDINTRIKNLNDAFSRIGKPMASYRAGIQGSWSMARHGSLVKPRPRYGHFDIGEWTTSAKQLWRIGWPLALLSTAVVALTLWLAFGINADSTFAHLTIADPVRAYQEWWASTRHSGGNILFMAISTCLIFYIALQNLVGFRLAWFFVSMFREYRNRIVLSADYRTPELRLGWQPLRDLWNTIMISIVCNFLSLLVIVSAYRSWRLTPLFVLFGCSLLFLVVPPYLLDGRLRDFRIRERSAAAEQLGQLYSEAEEIGWRRAYRDEFAMINDAKVTVILGRTMAFGRWVTVIGTIATFVAIFQK